MKKYINVNTGYEWNEEEIKIEAERFYSDMDCKSPDEAFEKIMKDMKEAKEVQVEYHDYRNGATSPIDVITVEKDYTPDDYIRDCKSNADSDGLEAYEEMEENGEFIFVELNED